MRASAGHIAFALSSTAAPSVWLVGQGPIGLPNLERVFGMPRCVFETHSTVAGERV
jgi:hypothetical protein